MVGWVVIMTTGAVATPHELVAALAQHGKQAGLQGVKVCHLHTEGVVSASPLIPLCLFPFPYRTSATFTVRLAPFPPG